MKVIFKLESNAGRINNVFCDSALRLLGDVRERCCNWFPWWEWRRKAKGAVATIRKYECN
jgi:hypothetical protein